MATINHTSVAAKVPKLVAERLAKLTDGLMKPFQPLDGAYVCMWLGGWSGSFIEIYPEGTWIQNTDSGPKFRHTAGDHPNATHINLTIEKSQDRVKAIADELNLPNGSRGWGGIWDVWLEDGLLIEFVCSAEAK